MCVEEKNVVFTWWNSTDLGEKLPSWEEYDLRQKEQDRQREEKRLTEIERQKAAGTWYGEIEDYDYDYEEVDNIE